MPTSGWDGRDYKPKKFWKIKFKERRK
jgi:hypothetical protein